MTFKFQWLCELLNELQANRHQRATTAARGLNPDHQTIRQWFNKYDHKIQRTGSSAVAFLSCLFPERRRDRVYNLQETRLSSIFGRALGLGHSRAAELNAWRTRDGDDFPTCVKRIMAQCEFDLPPSDREVTLEEIDAALHQIAANSIASSPAVRLSANGKTAGELLTPLLRRMRSTEAKWLVRLLLKSYGSVVIPEWFTLHQFHFLLPDLLTIQNSFDAAIKTLGKATICTLPPRPDKQYETALRPLMAREIVPELGVMIRRQPYHKARSIKHCCNLTKNSLMSIERKYDGEYCQIHIDLTKTTNCVQIFSKSGRDSTEDRLRLHGAIKDGLRIDRNGCCIREKCILEGELLVWSSTKKQILPFHKIRKHIKHGGRYLGTDNDSPVKSDERLMIVFYDLLVLDNKLLLNEPLTLRRQNLKGLIHNIEGRCIVGERVVVDFNSGRAANKLRKAFATSIVQRWEGLVLKACDEPFFSFKNANHGIKLKKDYIAGLGDTADLCIVGGRRDPKIEQELGLGHMRWTCFSVACLTNKEDVKRFAAKPRFNIIDELTSHSMPRSQLLEMNTIGHLLEVPFTGTIEEYDIEMGHPGMKRPSELFKEPFVVEIMGAGFERLFNASYYTLRFPRKVDGQVKLHADRTILETASFDELQTMAKRSLELVQDQSSQEDKEWMKKLLRVEGKSHSSRNGSQVTTPGRSPVSLATIRPTPPDTPKRKLIPFLIHADSQEATGQETRPTQFSDPSSYFLCPSTLVTSTSGNSGRASLESSNRSASATTPTRSSNKRRRLCNQAFIPVRSETVVHGITREAPNIINATAASFHSSTALSELPNVQQDKQLSHPRSSTDRFSGWRELNHVRSKWLTDIDGDGRLARQALPAYGDLATFSCSTALQSVQNSSVSRVEASRLPVKQKQNIYQELYQHSDAPTTARSLPTPPSSSEEVNTSKERHSHSVAGVTSKVDLLGKQMLTPSSSSLARHVTTELTSRTSETLLKNADESSRMLFTTRQAVTDPTLIVTSVSSPEKSSKHLSSLLRTTTSSFTFSMDNFVDQIDARTKLDIRFSSLHILLVNFKDVSGARKNVRELFKNFIFRAAGGMVSGQHELRTRKAQLLRYHNRVLVLDYRVLEQCNGERLDGNHLARLYREKTLAERFVGIVKLNTAGLDTGGKVQYYLETDWNWLLDAAG